MSELTKELEQDKAFIEKVANRIYSDTDDIESVMSEPEWICKMTDIADKYITRFEVSYNFANNLADELLASSIQLNEDQKIVLEWLKNDFHSYGGEVALFEAVADLTKIHRTFQELSKAYISLDVEQQGQVLAAFARWGLEQDKVQ